MKGKRKNILLVIPSLGGGGAQNVFRQHFKAFSPNHNVYRVIFNRDIVLEDEEAILSLDIPAGKNIIEKAYYFALRCYKLYVIKRTLNIDISISHLPGADYVNILSKRGERVILCIHGSLEHNQDLKGFIGLLQKKVLGKLLYKFADKIVIVSRELKNEIRRNTKLSLDKICVINNFFEVEKIKKYSCEPLEEDCLEIFSKNNILVTCGRLEPQKNQSTLFEIIEELKQNIPLKLVILGDGNERARLIEKGESLNLKLFLIWEGMSLSDDYDIYFLGHKSNPFKFISKSSIFLLPSLWEGFPLALGEAMACGIPVLSSDCPTGPKEMLSLEFFPSKPLEKAEYAEYGILLPMIDSKRSTYNRNITIWKKVIADLLNDKNLMVEYGVKARERISDFSKEKIIYKWNQVLEEEF